MLVDLAERHGFYQGHIVPFAMGPFNEVGDLVLVHPLHGDGVELDLHPRGPGSGDTAQHARQGIAARKALERVAAERVQRDIDPANPGIGNGLGVPRKLGRVGGQREFFQPRADMLPQRTDQIDDIAADERLASRETDLRYSTLHETQRKIAQFLQGEYFLARKELHPLRHAIGASQIATVGDRQAQIGDTPPEAVDEIAAAHACCISGRYCPVTPGAFSR